METILSKYVESFQHQLLLLISESEEMSLHPICDARWYQYQQVDLDTNELIFGSSQFSEKTFRIPASREDLLIIRRNRQDTYQFFRTIKYDYLETV